VIVGGSIPFCIASIFRFYVVSFFVDDVRMAQTIYFYGSLFTMFGLLVVFIITTFNTFNGDVSAPGVQALAVPWTLIDPAFGWFLIVLFQHNFLGQSHSCVMLFFILSFCSQFRCQDSKRRQRFPL
jgi:hypothetical protein